MSKTERMPRRESKKMTKTMKSSNRRRVGGKKKKMKKKRRKKAKVDNTKMKGLEGSSHTQTDI